MPCLTIPDGFICYNNRYCFEGFRFELHRYCGPFALRKDGELRENNFGRRSKFWPAYARFSELTEEERKQYEI